MWHLILSIVLALVFLVTGSGKVLGLAYAHRNRKALRLGPTFWRVTGLVEWAGAAGLVIGIWVPALGVAAASGLALFMIGAIVSRVRSARMVGKPTPPSGIVVDAVLFVLCVLDVVLIVRGV